MATLACVPFGFRMNSGFDVRLDLQTASHCLIVIAGERASLDVRFDFHTCILLMNVDVKS